MEILDRWQQREFRFLYSLDTLAEYAEKLLARGLPALVAPRCAAPRTNSGPYSFIRARASMVG